MGSKIVLSDGQEAALAAALAGRNIFITGPGGTGKSVLVEEIIEQLGGTKRVAVTASTGIAAIRVSGCTIHSWLGTQIKKNKAEASVLLNSRRVKNFGEMCERVKACQVLIIDEVSMLSGDYIDMINFWLKRIRVSKKPFGGIQVIFTGDFLQLPPVSKRADEVEYPYAFQASSWLLVEPEVHVLSKVFRQDDAEFVAALSRVRYGNTDASVLAYFNSRVGAELGDGDEPTCLYARNDAASMVNYQHLKAFEGEAKEYEAELWGEDQYAERLVRDCLAETFLELKVGAPVIFLWNDYEREFVNGERGVVERMDDDTIWVRKPDGNVVGVVPMTWDLKDANDKQLASLKQFPVKLAWALTIHKSQGMTLDLLECDVSECFAPGQAYVALSRVRSLAGLRLTEPMQARHVSVDPAIVAYCKSVEV
jgi:ATP-dependent exoDNAse (exonuclease V) alpha subunit